MQVYKNLDSVASRLYKTRGGGTAVIGPVRSWETKKGEMWGVVIGTTGYLDMVYLGKVKPEIDDFLASCADTVLEISGGDEISFDYACRIRWDLIMTLGKRGIGVIAASTEVETAEIWHEMTGSNKSSRILQDVKRDKGVD
jgi:hypothetical protein